MKSKFVEAIQSYQQVEQQYRQKYKQRMERQYKIGAVKFFSFRMTSVKLTFRYPAVKPDATPEEVKAVIDDDQGGQVFSQAVRTHGTSICANC